MTRSDDSAGSAGILRRRWPDLVAVTALALIFAFFTWARMPALDLPLSALRHGEGTARVLRHIDIWEQVGVAETRFMMRTTHAAPADRGIRDVGYLSDDDGIYYYVSFPPLFPLAPYAIFETLGIQATPRSVRWFNLWLQALGAAALYVLGRRVFSAMGERAAVLPATAAAGLYLVAPSLLWYHSAAYVTTSLSTPIFAFAVYLAVRLLHDEVQSRWLWPAYVVVVGLLAYTEWLAVTFALAAVGWALLRRSDTRARRFAFVTVATVGAVVALTVAQYSTVAGLSAFVDGVGRKYAMRSGYTESSHASVTSLSDWGDLAKVYWLSFAPLLVLPGILAVPAFADGQVRRGMRRLLAGQLGTALWLAGAATIVHHLVFFSHTVLHDFDLMKSVVPVALLVGLVVSGGFAALRRSVDLRRAATLLALLVVWVSIASLGWTMEKNFVYANAATYFGDAVRDARVAPDEVVFVESNGFYVGSAATYYAGRNIASYRSPEQAAEIMGRNGAAGGVLFTVDPVTNWVETVTVLGADGLPSTGEDVVIP